MPFKTLQEKLEDGGVIPKRSPIHEPPPAADMTAEEVPRAIVITAFYILEGQYVLETACADFDAYRALPSVVEYQGRRCGKTGWSSDRNYACYRSGVLIAM